MQFLQKFFVDIFPLSEAEGPSFLWQFVLSDVIYSNQGCLRTYYLKIYFIFFNQLPTDTSLACKHETGGQREENIYHDERAAWTSRLPLLNSSVLSECGEYCTLYFY